MSIRQLLRQWEDAPVRQLTAKKYEVRLPVRDAARISALVEMYPGTDAASVITDLLSAALDELEAAMPYVQGTTVVAEDEEGDPIYEDVGPTPRFVELTRNIMRRIEEDSAA